MTFDLKQQIDLANSIALAALKSGVEIGRQEAKEQATAQEQTPKPHGDPESGTACKPASVAAPIPAVAPSPILPPSIPAMGATAGAEVEEALNALELWYERYGSLFDLQPIAVAIADFLFPRG